MGLPWSEVSVLTSASAFAEQRGSSGLAGSHQGVRGDCGIWELRGTWLTASREMGPSFAHVQGTNSASYLGHRSSEGAHLVALCQQPHLAPCAGGPSSTATCVQKPSVNASIMS